ncbi:MAG: Rieske 2Fe-2S domain-containing protein [Actinobacteria bacterium]|nr:Rieske 2Fe-2S domain-containing protein [Actinomycetota bacterium]
MDRRRFLNSTWKVLGAALLVEAGWTSYDILSPNAAEGFGGLVDAGPVSDFLAEGTVKYFLDGRFYVTQYQGGLRALYQKCPHLGCKVPFCDSSTRFECPCHGSVYNVIGEYVRGPAPRGMDRFPIRIRNDRVMVDTSSVVEGPPRGVMTGPTEAAGPSCQGEAPAVPGVGGGMSPGGMSPGASGQSPGGMPS